jgi:PKD repeat protein
MAATCTASLAQNNHWCATEQNALRQLEADPGLIQTIEQMQRDQAAAGHNGPVRGGGMRIIPVVFHVIHMGGAENISRAQILDQVQTLNLDYSRTNLDTANTRPIFKPVAAGANVEFRLATLDPNGNCTDGVVRVMSPLTENATDAVKAVSYWPSNKYFNVWVVKSIDSDGGGGTTLGYAQFPGFGSAQTDGVVIRHDYTGSIGTAAPFGGAGRTLTHEAGHWLGLFHTFQGGCAGGFFGEAIDDTPPVLEANSTCSFSTNTCTNDNPDLPDQIENYMDYTGGTCQNMFTIGQVDAMNTVLNSTRSNIHSQANLTATGTAQLIEPQCAPVAALTASTWLACTGDNVTYTDASYNGTVTDYDWQLPGASPASSTSASPTVTYSSPGVYSATLTAGNANGSDSYTAQNLITIIPSTVQLSTFQVQEGFEQVNPDIVVYNQGNLGSMWERDAAAATGSYGYRIDTRDGNPAGVLDEFVLPSMDLTQMGNSPSLTFKVAYRQRNSNNTISQERLRVYVSVNCGQTWAVRYNKVGTSLSSVSGAVTNDWAPTTAADWKEESVSMTNFIGESHVLVKFQSTSDAGNSIYIDDINISGPLGIDGAHAYGAASISPLPVDATSTLTLQCKQGGQVHLSVIDAAGRVVVQRTEQTGVGEQRIALGSLAQIQNGWYSLRISGIDGVRALPFVR